MDRWTERFDSDGEKAIAIHDGSGFPDVCFEGERGYDVINALADYEDLEEQGLLLKLPCEIGTTVYAICTCQNVSKILDDELNFATGYYCPYDLYRNCPHTGDNLCEEVAYKKAVFEDEVESFFFQGEKLYIELKYTKYCMTVGEIGKTIFSTREEAEKKLKEVEVSNGTKQNE